MVLIDGKRYDDLNPDSVAGQLHDLVASLPSDPMALVGAARAAPALNAALGGYMNLAAQALQGTPDSIFGAYYSELAQIPGIGQSLAKFGGGLLGTQLGTQLQGEVRAYVEKVKSDVTAALTTMLVSWGGGAAASGQLAGLVVAAAAEIGQGLIDDTLNQGLRRRGAYLKYMIGKDLTDLKGTKLLQATWSGDPAIVTPPAGAPLNPPPGSVLVTFLGPAFSYLDPWSLKGVLTSVLVSPAVDLKATNLTPTAGGTEDQTPIGGFGPTLTTIVLPMPSGRFQWLNGAQTMRPLPPTPRVVDEKGAVLAPVLRAGSVYRLSPTSTDIVFVPGWVPT
jgi:hypothetical protein